MDPLTDFGFKHIFGSEPSKELLISFLNEIFKGRKVITDLTYNKNEYTGPRTKSRRMIFDLTCTGQNGEQFIIEVQRIYQPYFRDRAVYYTSRLIHDQAPKGGKWDYSLKEVYFIRLMDSVLEESDPKKFLHRVRLSYEGSGKEFFKKLGYIFIEIPKFAKTENELKSGVDKWLYVLKNLSRLQKIPVILDDRIFSKLFNIAAVSNLTKEDFMKYEKDLMAEWDEYAYQKAMEEKEKSLLIQGEERKSYEVVKNLFLVEKFTIAEISNFANVSEAFVRKLKKELK